MVFRSMRGLRPQLLDASGMGRFLRQRGWRTRLATRRYPSAAEALRTSDIFNAWWYYTVELLPGVVTTGIYPEDLPLLPRVALRNCNIAGQDCLDLGSMEGLIPVLMHRQGARRVLATDATLHCFEKMDAVKHYYDAKFDFRQVGLMYDLSDKLRREGGFDLINLSGILYHVFSPMHVIASVRPLLRKDGLMILSTNVVNRSDFTMEFNNAGKLQTEINTFWYVSIPLLDYMLRYFKLLPIDCIYLPHTARDPVRHAHGVEAGYLSVVCRATADAGPYPEDGWGAASMRSSWEWIALCDENMLASQPTSSIGYRKEIDPRFAMPDKRSIDLLKAVRESTPMLRAEQRQDSHILGLDDRS